MSANTFSWSIFEKQKGWKNFTFFFQSHGLSPLQKCQFCLLFKYMFILSGKTFFLTRTSPNTFSGCILHKTKRWQNYKFLTKNHGLTSFEKCQFCGFLKPTFLLFRKVCLLYNTSKIVFSRFIFTIYDLGIQGLQGDTGGCKRLQGVTRG